MDLAIATISLVIGLLILWLVESLFKRKKIRIEFSRKVIHVVSGIILLIWLYTLSRPAIIFAEICFLIVVIVARKFKVFASQYSISRISYGEIFYSIGIIALLLLHVSNWVFIIAVLHIALADTASALVGIKYGKNNSYNVMGQKKSIAGSAAFFVTSVMIVGAVMIFTPDLAQQKFVALLLTPLFTTAAENLGVYGLDNLTIPLIVAALLA